MHLCWSIVAAWFQRPFRDTNFTWNDWQRLVGPCGSEGPQVGFMLLFTVSRTSAQEGSKEGWYCTKNWYQTCDAVHPSCDYAQGTEDDGHFEWCGKHWDGPQWDYAFAASITPLWYLGLVWGGSARVIWSWGARFFTWMMGTAWCRHTGSSGGRSQTLPWWMIRKCTSLESLAQPTSRRLISKHKQCRHLTSSHFSTSTTSTTSATSACIRCPSLQWQAAGSGNSDWQRQRTDHCDVAQFAQQLHAGDVLEDVGWPWADGQIWLCILALWFSTAMQIWAMLSWTWWTARLLMNCGRFSMAFRIGHCLLLRFAK